MAVHRPQPASARVWKEVLEAAVELRTLSRHSPLKSRRDLLDVDAGVHSCADTCAIPREHQVWNHLAPANKSQGCALRPPVVLQIPTQRSRSWTCSTTSSGNNCTPTHPLPHPAALQPLLHHGACNLGQLGNHYDCQSRPGNWPLPGSPRPAAAPRLPQSDGYDTIPSAEKSGRLAARGARTSEVRGFRANDYVTINAYWFALSYLCNSIHPIVLPMLVPLMAPASLKGSALGIMTSIALVVAVIVQPAAGAISDQSTFRWGRRRPYVLVGTLFDLLLLLGIALAGSYWLLLAAYLLLQLSSNVAHGPYQGLIPDLVREDRRGAASGAKQLAEILGVIVTSKVTPYFMGWGTQPSVSPPA